MRRFSLLICMYHVTWGLFSQSADSVSDVKTKNNAITSASVEDWVVPYIFNFTDHPGYTGGQPDLNLYGLAGTSMFIDRNYTLAGTVAADVQVGKTNRHGVGGYVYGQKTGGQIGYGALFSYSYLVFQSAAVKLRLGASVGFNGTYRSPSDFVWGDMIDNRYGIIYQTQEQTQEFSVLSSAGIYFQASGFGAAVSVHHYIPRYLSTANHINANPIAIQTDLYYQFHLKKIHLMPYLRSQVDVAGNYVFEPGIHFFGNPEYPFIAGVSYNTAQYICSTVGYNIKNRYRLGLYYRVPLTPLFQTLPVSDISCSLIVRL